MGCSLERKGSRLIPFTKIVKPIVMEKDFKEEKGLIT